MSIRLGGVPQELGDPPRLLVSERPIPCSQGPPSPSLRYLQMGPGSFQGGLILFRVKLGPSGVR